MGSLPEDMEDRRLADLEKFALNNPDHPMVPLLMQQVKRTEVAESEAEGELGASKEGSWYHWLREQQLRPARKGKRQSSGKQGINKWDKASTLELLAELKKFQETLTALNIRGIRVTSESRWATVAKNLPNRCGLEPAKFARSCKVHFVNMCRVYRAQRTNSKGEECLDPQVREALEDYFQLGGDNVPSPPPRNLLEGKNRVEKEDNGNAINVKFSTLHTEKIDQGGKRPQMAATAKATVEKLLNTIPVNGGSRQQGTKNGAFIRMNHEINNDSWEGPDSKTNQSNKRLRRWESPVFKSSDAKGPEASGAYKNPHEQEEIGNQNTKRMKRWESPVLKSPDGEGPGATEANEDPHEKEEIGNQNTKRVKRWESPVFKSPDGEGHGAAEANKDPHEKEELGNQNSKRVKKLESPVFHPSDDKGPGRPEANEDSREQEELGNQSTKPEKRWESPVSNLSDGKAPKAGDVNEDPQEQEELGNPHRQDQYVNPAMESATLETWDKASSLQLLEAMAKVGPQAVNGWETVASLLPNYNKMDPQEFVLSCKEQYRELLRTYKKGKWVFRAYSGYKPLTDEVNAQIEKLLQSRMMLKADNLKNTEISRVERRGMESERVAMKPPFSPRVIHHKNKN